VKRLYDSSLGRLELELDAHSVVSIWLFDEEGRVARESGDEWDNTDVGHLLEVDIGLPADEAQSIASSFRGAAEDEGFEEPEGPVWIGMTVGIAILTGLLIALGVGVWTIATSLTVEIATVGLLLFAMWVVPAVLLLRWRDRRREKRAASR
jgi:Flp pilus assembly protein TadB